MVKVQRPSGAGARKRRMSAQARAKAARKRAKRVVKVGAKRRSGPRPPRGTRRSKLPWEGEWWDPANIIKRRKKKK